jgi:hypothetical protein
MARFKILCLLILVLFQLFLEGIIFAQSSPSDGNAVISELIEDASASDAEESDPSALAEEMSGFLDHPLNLNSASLEELRQLQLLTDFQIYSLLDYIRNQSELLSIYELQLVYGFDRQIIERLIPFVLIGSGKSQNSPDAKKHFSQNLIFRVSTNGKNSPDKSADSSAFKVFEGANRSLMLRYQAEISCLKFGFTSEQDAGESFNSGGGSFRPDFNSAFLEYQGKKYIKKLIIGDFKTAWGQGLVLGGFGTRKGSQVLLSPGSTGLKKYSSAGENNFFRGVAASAAWRNISMEIFFSNLKIDAGIHSIVKDTSEMEYFSAPDLSGLHRNKSEIEKKDAVICMNSGLHVQINKDKMMFGISYLSQQFDHTWMRNNTAYRSETFPSHVPIHNFSSDFKASLGKLSVFSELALDTKARTAIFGGILAELHPLIRLSLVYRNYRPDYLGSRSSGFGEGRGTKNEEGFYIGLQVYPWKYLKVDMYADHYSFPFLRYNSTNPYSGNDYLLNFSLTPNREFSVNMRLRYEKNQNRSATSRTGIDRMQTSQKAGFRVELNYQVNNNLKLRTRVESSYFQNAENPMSKGFYSGHDLNIQSNSQKYKLWIRYAIFDIPEWENRIYAYENDVLYSFSVPAFNSKGARFIIMAKAEIFKGFELCVRYAVSQVPEKNSQTTSNGNKTYTIQAIYKF